MTTKNQKPKPKATKVNKKSQETASDAVVAKTPDGTVQITFTIPWEVISKNQTKAATELGENLDIPGFRKGKAPIEKIIKKVPENDLLQKTLANKLPELLAKAISENKIKPAIYPRFEVLKSTEGENWQVRAVTCEIPVFELGDYKNKVKGSLKSKAIWTPDKAGSEYDQDETKEIPLAEKEQQVLKILLTEIKVDVPNLLINEEVNAKLSQLLEKIEKLGLDLDAYLKSIGKTADTLRTEYEGQAKDTISLELILSKIAQEEKIIISDEQIAQAIEAAVKADPKSKERLETPEQKNYIRSLLSRRTVIDQLISLV